MNQKKGMRLSIYFGCLLFASTCFLVMRSHYSPLARYPYGNEDERTMIMENLNDAEIDYLVNAQMTPQIFLPFIQADGFVLSNAPDYYEAWSTRPSDVSFIVTFVNETKDSFPENSLERLLQLYTYGELIQYLNSGINMPLEENPQEFLMIPTGERNMWVYRPDGMVMLPEGVWLKEEAASAWNAMQQAAAADDVSLPVEDGWISYTEQADRVTGGHETAFTRLPAAGTWEEQLGYTVTMPYASIWNSLAEASDVETTYNYERIEGQLSEEAQKAKQWLDEHAWQYGYIIRYPFGNEKSTGRRYQPFVLRYVGEDSARTMHEQSLSLEDYKKQLGTNAELGKG